MDHELYLTTVYDNMEADILESLLNSYNVPVLRKYRGAGGLLKIYMGNAITPIEFYVPSKLYDFAKNIIESEAHQEYGE